MKVKVLVEREFAGIGLRKPGEIIDNIEPHTAAHWAGNGWVEEVRTMVEEAKPRRPVTKPVDDNSE